MVHLSCWACAKDTLACKNGELCDAGHWSDPSNLRSSRRSVAFALQLRGFGSLVVNADRVDLLAVRLVAERVVTVVVPLHLGTVAAVMTNGGGTFGTR